MEAPYGFTDCFALCDNSIYTNGGFCSSFTFTGANADGTGPGRCYLKSDYEIAAFTPGGRVGLVGGIRRSPRDVVTVNPPTISGSSTASSSMSSRSGSSTASSASPSASVACGSTYTTSEGIIYNTYCDSDTDVGSFDTENVPLGDFRICASGCASRPTCQVFVFNPNGQGGTCFYKASVGNRVSSPGFVAGARVQTSTSSSTMTRSSMPTPSSSTMFSPSGNNQATSSPSSMTMVSSSTTSTLPSSTIVPMRLADAQCPRDDREYVSDNYGIVYQIGCSSDTAGGSVNQRQAISSFKDCFALCDNSFEIFGSVCASFAYAGGLNGVGGGTCYLKADQGADTGFVVSDQSHVGGIRISPNDIVTATPMMSMMSTMSTSSSSLGGLSSSSSMAGISSSSSMEGMPSSSSLAGMSTSSPMAGMSTSSPMAGMSTSSPMAGMSTSSPTVGMSSSMGDMQSSSSMDGMSTSSYPAGDSSSMGMMSSSTIGDMTSITMSSMPSGMFTTSGGSSTDMSSTSPNGMTTSAETPDEGSSPAAQTSSAMMTSPPVTSLSATETAEESPVSSTSSLEACPTDTEGLEAGDGGECTSPYGNTFNVTSGTVYTGRITVRAVRPNVASCLTLCDETPGCEAINYIGQDCQILVEVTGNYTAPGVDAVAATRAPDATTTFTMPPTSMTSMMPVTSAPVSNGSPSTTNGGTGSISTASSQGGSNPGSSPGASTPGMTGGSSMPSNAASTPNGGQSSPSNGGSPGQSTPSGSGGSSPGGQQSYMSTSGAATSITTMPTTPNPSSTEGAGPSSSGASGYSTINDGPGPVDASNSGIVPGASSTGTGMSSTPISMSMMSPSGTSTNGGAGTTMSMSMSMTNGASGDSSGAGSQTSGGTATFSNDPNQNNGGTIRPTTSSSPPPASTGAVCPFYDNSQYTDSRGSTYTVDCNGTYTGNVLLRTNSTTTPGKAKRQANYGGTGLTAPQCMVLCDTTANCLAINMDCAGMCTLLSSVTGTTEGTCGVAARRISGGNGGNAGGGVSGVSTITVCAVRTGTMTVFTTATLTTCAAMGECPGGMGRMGML